MPGTVPGREYSTMNNTDKVIPHGIYIQYDGETGIKYIQDDLISLVLELKSICKT